MSASCGIPNDAAALHGRSQAARRGVPTARMENRFRHKDGSGAGSLGPDGRERIDLFDRPPRDREKLARRRYAKASGSSDCLQKPLPITPDQTRCPGVVSGWNAGAQRIEGYAEQKSSATISPFL